MAPKNDGNSFFMTPEESKRIVDTAVERKNKRYAVKGEERASGDLPSLKREVTSASFMADMAASSNESTEKMPVLPVGDPYPPCTASIKDLELMKLSELRLETHHRGKFLRLYRATPVVELKGASWTVAKDEASDDVQRVRMVLHKSSYGEDILDSGKYFTIREPYFTLDDQEEAVIRIDHPSDITVSQSSQESTTNDSKDVAEKAGKCKAAGNAALKKKEYKDAHTSYTEGIDLFKNGATDAILPDLFRNRAYVNLYLKRFDEAKTDGKASITSGSEDKQKSLDSKACFRAGQAAYNLGLYDEAKELFEQQKSLAPEDKDAALYLRSIAKRVEEQTKGVYDLQKIHTTVSAARPRVDVANFNGSTIVKDSPGAGRGLFATHGIKAGEIVMVEKAFYVARGHDNEAWTAMAYDYRDDNIRGCPAGLCQMIVEKLSSNPSQLEAVLDLFGDYAGTGKKPLVVDGRAVIDTFQIHDIVARNAFGTGPVTQDVQEDVLNASTGLWVRTAYTNHSCNPNATKDFIGDLVVMRAVRNIAAGEEISICYDATPDHKVRAASLKRTWGFECQCNRCQAAIRK